MGQVWRGAPTVPARFSGLLNRQRISAPDRARVRICPIRNSQLPTFIVHVTYVCGRITYSEYPDVRTVQHDYVYLILSRRIEPSVPYTRHCRWQGHHQQISAGP